MSVEPNPDIDLGLAVSALSLRYGETRTQVELAAFCNCSPQRIDQIEQKALRKIRNALRDNPKYAELREYIYKGGLNEELPWWRGRGDAGQSSLSR